MSTPSTPTIAGYEDLSLIGAGGFSRVYLADQSKLKRRVAIKVLNFGLEDDNERRSFERETELMARVSMHPSIATIHDTAFTERGQPCIVMGHYQGGSLADLTSRVGRLSVKEAIEVGIAIASALDASHSAGIVHCDIKPQNILISAYGQPALGDFGISTFADERTQTGDAGSGFTLAYAAPEILDGESPSVATDLYSLAATLYASLAGHRPFARPEDSGPVAATEQARRIVLDVLAPLPGIPSVLDTAIRTTMGRNPDERPASAARFATQLYEIGQALGLAISVPQTSDRAALPMPGDGATAPAEPGFAAAAPAIDPTRLLIKAPPTATRNPGSRNPGSLPPEPAVADRSRTAMRVAIAVVVLLAGVLGAFLFLRASADSAISGPATIEAGTSGVYTVPDADPGTIRWIDWNNEVVIQDSLELTGVMPGIVRFSVIASGERYTHEVTVEASDLGPSIDGPSSLQVGESATYTATTPDVAMFTWSTSSGTSGVGSTFVLSQVTGGTIVQVIATANDGVERGNQLRINVDG